MKKKLKTTTINKCGGKSSGCAVEFELPKLETPIRISDNVTK
jgi:hypothetical protein